MMKRAEYKELMAKIAEGGKVNQKTYDELLEFAKKNKTKRPAAEAVLDEAEVKKTAKAAKKAAEPKAPKEKAPKAKCSVTKGEGKGQDPKMSTKTCPNESRAGGMCATHYSRLLYRAQPDKAEKAREASRNYAARKRAEKAKAKAEAEKTSSAA